MHLSGKAAEPSAAEDPFAPDRLIEIQVTMDPDDWHALRISHRYRDENQRFTDSPYEYYRADVTIDGSPIRSVGVRKKGFIGSAVSTRPSLKINLDKYVDGQEFEGLEMMTLNNNNQDPTKANQFLVYSFFEKAGVMTPRCNFAHVTVNGEDLGIYSHVEPIRKPFFKRHFGQPKGDLYEGYAVDFRDENRLNEIQHKWGPDDDREKLRELFDLLQAPSLIPLVEVEKLLDLDGFIALWAAEVLIGHADGYSGNRNNWYAYRNKESGLFHFVPWGTDSAFRDPSPYITYPVPKSVKARGYLCERLWESPEVRVRYRKEMQRLLDEVWDEEAMLADLDRIIRRHTGHPAIERDMVAGVESNMRDFIEHRRSEIQMELDVPAGDWPKPPVAEAGSSGRRGVMVVSGTFSTTMREIPSTIASVSSGFDPFGDPPRDVLAEGKGDAQMDYTIWYSREESEEHTPFSRYGVVAMPDRRGYRKDYPVVQIVAADESGALVWNLRFTLDPHQVQPGANKLPLDLFTAQACLSQGWPGSPGEQHRVFDVRGEVELEAFGLEPGAPVKGTFMVYTRSFDEP